MNEKIELDGRNLSVVIQGQFTQVTNDALRSVRFALPGSQIILSTWPSCIEVIGQEARHLADKIIISDDPGPVKRGATNTIVDEIVSGSANANRMIVSSVNGMKASERAYVLRIRSDFLVKSSGFAEFYNDMMRLRHACGLVDDSILITGIWEPLLLPTLFYACDLLHLAPRDTAIALFDTHLVDSSEEHINSEQKIATNYIRRFCPDAHISNAIDYNAKQAGIWFSEMIRRFVPLNTANTYFHWLGRDNSALQCDIGPTPYFTTEQYIGVLRHMVPGIDPERIDQFFALYQSIGFRPSERNGLTALYKGGRLDELKQSLHQLEGAPQLRDRLRDFLRIMETKQDL